MLKGDVRTGINCGWRNLLGSLTSALAEPPKAPSFNCRTDFIIIGAADRLHGDPSPMDHAASLSQAGGLAKVVVAVAEHGCELPYDWG